MAKEIKPIERGVLTPGSQLRPNTAFSALGEVTSELGNLAAGILADQSAYYSGLAGEQDVREGKAPKTLLPPIGKATAAYNQAVANTEARQLANQGREMILQTYAEMANPATFNTQTPAEFSARVTGITQGILDNARPENKEAVAAQLEQYAVSARVKMLDNSIEYDNTQTQASFNRDLSKAKDQLREAIFSQDADMITRAQQNIGDILADYSIINQQIENQLPKITEELNKQVKVDQVVGEFLQSYNQGTEVQFLDNLTKSKPENLTTEEYFAAMQKVLQVENSLQAAESRYNQEQYAKAHFEIQTGQINNLEQLTQEYGNKVPAASFYSLSETLLSRKKAEDSVYAVESARRFGANEVAKLPNKVLNDYYIEREKQLVTEFNSNLAENQMPIARLNLAQRAEFIVLPAGAPIPDFLTDLSYGLQSSNDMVAMDAVNAYRVLFKNQGEFGNTLRGLDSNSDDIAQYVLSLGDVSEAEVPGLIKTAQYNVNDRSDTTLAARRDRLQKMYALKDGVNILQSTYKKSYGSLPDNANVDAHYGAFQKLFDNYFMGVANGSESVALAMTQNALRDWNKSRFGQPDEIMYSPPDMIPFANVGKWMDNQYGEALNGLLTRLEKLETGYARPEWMVNVPISKDTTDAEIMGTNYYPKYSALVNGIEREVFVQSTRNTRTSSYPGEVYQFFYKDDYGVKQYLPNPDDQLGAATWIAKQMFQYVPQAYASLQDDTIEQVARETFDRENKFKTNAFGDTNLPIDVDVATFGTSSLAAKRKPTEQELKAIKDRLKRVGSKQIVFKDGKPVEATDPPAQTTNVTIITEEPVSPNLNIELENIGRRKKK